jgi:hypothetical protein
VNYLNSGPFLNVIIFLTTVFTVYTYSIPSTEMIEGIKCIFIKAEPNHPFLRQKKSFFSLHILFRFRPKFLFALKSINLRLNCCLTKLPTRSIEFFVKKTFFHQTLVNFRQKIVRRWRRDPVLRKTVHSHHSLPTKQIEARYLSYQKLQILVNKYL